ncbi:hypothetical protein E2562_034477 [Oryza meyeriana var. granulata]|uniref:DUF834 domain-containing protein n=1 Tax=Oryza meyeriana var. granulata TaxID=110450 RepID=A0A6G1ESM7_9ORYZ|nr:hypothetical protein E2562_034477 [Oryza meyeriana var. granulata]
MVGAGVQTSEVWGRAAAAVGARAAGRGRGARYTGLQGQTPSPAGKGPHVLGEATVLSSTVSSGAEAKPSTGVRVDEPRPAAVVELITIVEQVVVVTAVEGASRVLKAARYVAHEGSPDAACVPGRNGEWGSLAGARVAAAAEVDPDPKVGAVASGARRGAASVSSKAGWT